MDPVTDSLLDAFDAPPERVRATLADATQGAEDGELFVEARRTETLVYEAQRLKSGSYVEDRGFGLRVVDGESTGYASSGDLSEASLRRAAETAAAARRGYGGEAKEPPPGTNRRAYGEDDPLAAGFPHKVGLLGAVDAYARGRDGRIAEVTVTLDSIHQVVEILRPDGRRVRDVRPLVRMNVAVVAAEGERREMGSFGFGGRNGFDAVVDEAAWQHAADEAVRLALVALDAGPAPAGEMDVVLGAGWPGILLHEAVGHGLEGDINRKGIGAFGTLMGQRIAAPGVTVVDDGTVPGQRGSVTVDDEGTPGDRTVLIEDGILVGYMQDRKNGRLMGMQPTGNGRRQSYAHVPMPRMTNTFMLGGTASPSDIIASVRNGLYAVSFGGGQVDITSGKFVFTCTEAYRIENGRLGAPVKGAVLIGNGPDALTRIRMIGNDMRLDPGIGNCGKYGQLIPVGVGQPTLRIDGLTVGGTAT